MIKRQLIGKDTLNKAIDLYNNKKMKIATIIRFLDIDKEMNYRTAFNIIKADLAGYDKATRPLWLTKKPIVQTAPEDWRLIRGLSEFGYWVNK